MSRSTGLAVCALPATRPLRPVQGTRLLHVVSTAQIDEVVHPVEIRLTQAFEIGCERERVMDLELEP